MKVKILKAAVSKIVAFVDEIIIVDTGSTDNTKPKQARVVPPSQG